MDLGCGPGIFAKTVGVRNIIGIDISPSMLDIARTRMDTVHENNIFELQMEEDSVDNVITLFVLADYPSEKKAEFLRRVHSCLKRGGRFFFSAYSSDDGYFRDLGKINVNESGEGFTLHIEDKCYYFDVLSDIGFDVLESEAIKVPTILERDSRVAKAGSKLVREFIVLVARKLR